MTIVVLTGSGSWQPPAGLASIHRVVVVGGGGGGGGSEQYGYPGGGGGGGGVVVAEGFAITPDAPISYSVGNGGAGGAAGDHNPGTSGQDTTFGSITAIGGGGGGALGPGLDGGSGGGGSWRSVGGSALQPGSVQGGFGNAGGAAEDDWPAYPGGGGGGAGSAGADATPSTAGAGGAGHAYAGEVYGSVGGGASYDNSGGGAGGVNAGAGGSEGSESGGAGVSTFGGGGGGGAGSDIGAGSGGAGGSGTIILVVLSEFVDWGQDVNPLTDRIYYALEVDDGVLDPIRPPISSWQATVQSDRASYAQAVIPAATSWVAPISARVPGELIIYRGVRFPDGTTQESEMARAPLGDVRFDVGPTNATMTISGYSTVPPTEQALTRTLRNVRSESTANGLHRVRCDIDFFLRPGHTAISRGTAFKVAYINYYVNVADEYMDVGERAEPVSPVLLAGQAAASGQALTLVAGATVTIAAGQSVAGGRALVPDVGP